MQVGSQTWCQEREWSSSKDWYFLTEVRDTAIQENETGSGRILNEEGRMFEIATVGNGERCTEKWILEMAGSYLK